MAALQRPSRLRILPVEDPTASRKRFGLKHRLLQLFFCQKLFQPGVLLVQLGQSPGPFGKFSPILLVRSVDGLLRHFDHASDIGGDLSLCYRQLLGSCQER